MKGSDGHAIGMPDVSWTDETEYCEDKGNHHETDEGYVDTGRATLCGHRPLVDNDEGNEGSDDTTDLVGEVLNGNVLALLGFCRIGPLDETRDGPKHRGGEAKKDTPENREPLMASAVVVEETSDIDGISSNTDGHGQPGAKYVKDCSCKEAKNGVDSIKRAVGNVADSLGGGFSSSSSKTKDSEVDTDCEEENDATNQVLIEGTPS